MVVISGIIIVSDEARDEVLSCLASLRKETLEQDAGVVAYRVGVDMENTSEVHIYEEWESIETLKAHMQKPHMDAFRELRKKYDVETSGFSRWRAEELGEF